MRTCYTLAKPITIDRELGTPTAPSPGDYLAWLYLASVQEVIFGQCQTDRDTRSVGSNSSRLDVDPSPSVSLNVT